MKILSTPLLFTSTHHDLSLSGQVQLSLTPRPSAKQLAQAHRRPDRSQLTIPTIEGIDATLLRSANPKSSLSSAAVGPGSRHSWGGRALRPKPVTSHQAKHRRRHRRRRRSQVFCRSHRHLVSFSARRGTIPGRPNRCGSAARPPRPGLTHSHYLLTPASSMHTALR